jgi:hypothetical protein
MGKVAMGLSMSLDGFIAGPNDGPERPLGESAGVRRPQHHHRSLGAAAGGGYETTMTRVE